MCCLSRFDTLHEFAIHYTTVMTLLDGKFAHCQVT